MPHELQRDPETGHLVGIEPKPVHSESAEYPKWVTPHASHVDDSGRALGFAEHHVDRAGTVTVLVHDETEEERALKAKPKAEAEKAD